MAESSASASSGVRRSGSAAASAASGKPKVAYVTNGIDPFWNVAAAGAKVALWDIKEDAVRDMAAEIGGLPVACDVTDKYNVFHR